MIVSSNGVFPNENKKKLSLTVCWQIQQLTSYQKEGFITFVESFLPRAVFGKKLFNLFSS